MAKPEILDLRPFLAAVEEALRELLKNSGFPVTGTIAMGIAYQIPGENTTHWMTTLANREDGAALFLETGLKMKAQCFERGDRVAEDYLEGVLKLTELDVRDKGKTLAWKISESRGAGVSITVKFIGEDLSGKHVHFNKFVGKKVRVTLEAYE